MESYSSTRMLEEEEEEEEEEDEEIQWKAKLTSFRNEKLLPDEKTLNDLGKIPNEAHGSDHFPLCTTFHWRQ